MAKLLSEGRGTVHVLGKLEDFELLRQCVLESCKLAKRAKESIRKTESAIENKENTVKYLNEAAVSNRGKMLLVSNASCIVHMI